MKRLQGQTGFISESGNAIATVGGVVSLKKPAILVHAGSFMSSDGPIEFDAARLERVCRNQNAICEALEKEYGGASKMPIGAYPAILNSHDDDDNDKVVGRLTGKLKVEIRDVPKVGKNIPCIVTDEITFLGAETCEKANDGRIYHLSVGIDESTDTLGEVSTVVVPAAPGAMLLKKGDKPVKKEKRMSLKRLKALKSLHSEAAATLKTVKAASEVTRLEARKGAIAGRFTKLMAGGKITPAEFKKQDLTKLAALDESALDIIVESFESREPVIRVGQAGSVTAPDFAKMTAGKQATEMKRLKAEIAKDFSKGGAKLKRMSYGENTAEGGEKEKELAFGDQVAAKLAAADKSDDETEMAAEKDEDEKKLAGKMADLKKHLDAGDLDGAKKCMSEIEGDAKGMKRMSAGAALGGQEVQAVDAAAMGKMQEQIDQLQTVLAKVTTEVANMIKAEEADAAQLGEQGSDEAEMAEDAEQGDQAALAGEKPGEEKKDLEAGEKPGEEKKDLDGAEKPGEEKKDLGAEKPGEEKKDLAGEKPGEEKKDLSKDDSEEKKAKSNDKAEK